MLKLQGDFEGLVVQSVPKGVNIPNDMYRALAVYAGDDAKLAEISVARESVLIKGLNEKIVQFKDLKNIELTKFYTKEQAVVEMKEIMKGYDALDWFIQKITEDYNQYLASSKGVDDRISQALLALQKNADEYAYQASLPKEAYQPIQYISLPKVELPKTTNCHISYTGVYGNYDITCN